MKLTKWFLYNRWVVTSCVTTDVTEGQKNDSNWSVSLCCARRTHFQTFRIRSGAKGGQSEGKEKNIGLQSVCAQLTLVASGSFLLSSFDIPFLLWSSCFPLHRSRWPIPPLSFGVILFWPDPDCYIIASEVAEWLLTLIRTQSKVHDKQFFFAFSFFVGVRVTNQPPFLQRMVLFLACCGASNVADWALLNFTSCVSVLWSFSFKLHIKGP